MFNPIYFYSRGRTKPENAYVPTALISSNLFIVFSTRYGNAFTDNNAGTVAYYETGKMIDFSIPPGNDQYGRVVSFNSTSNGIVTVNFLKGLRDVYSLWLLSSGNNAGSTYNITSIGDYLKQFQNLYSYKIDLRQLRPPTTNVNILKGDLGDVPKNLEKIYIVSLIVPNPTTDVYLNFNSFPENSKLKYLSSSPTIKLQGDLINIPKELNYIYFSSLINDNLTYTGGKIWASAFDSFYLYTRLSSSINDAILNDMATYITSAIGNKYIVIEGLRTSASDSAVLYLKSLGFTVITYKLYNSATDTKNVRYVTDYANGTNVSSGTFWIEIQAFKDGVNVASGCIANMYNAPNKALVTSVYTLTDGNTAAGAYIQVGGDSVAEIDLGSVKSIDSVNIRRFYGRTFYGTRVAVSQNKEDYFVLWQGSENGYYNEISSGKTLIL